MLRIDDEAHVKRGPLRSRERHSLNSLLVLWALRLARLPPAWSLLSAALFAAHPIHVENIVYLVGRADALATSFYVLALILYQRNMKKATGAKVYGGYVLLTLLSGLCARVWMAKSVGFPRF